MSFTISRRTRRGCSSFSVVLFVGFALAQSATVTHNNAVRRLAAEYGKLPLGFEPNQGQANAPVKFLSRGLGPTIYFSPQKVTLGSGKDPAPFVLRFLHAHPTPQITALDKLPGTINYLIGSDSSKWLTQIPTYAMVRYAELYPGINVCFHGTGGQLEYDFGLAPGAEVARIRLRFEGAAWVRSEANGDLVIERNGTQIRQHQPRAYQTVNGVRREVAVRTVVDRNNEVRFALGAYDHKRALVIDPVLVYSTYLGGSGGFNIDFSDGPAGVAADSAGNIYLAGAAASPDFPVTAGAYQTQKPASADFPAAFVAKLKADGSALIYSTFIGGSDADIASGIAVDAAGHAYITGTALSTDFPLVKPFQSRNNDKSHCIAGPFINLSPCSAFVAELNATGNALLYSSYLGGSGSDSGTAIAVDAQSNAYVSGTTTSTDFPVTGSAAQPTYGGGGSDAFVEKVSATGSLAYATYLGGSFDDSAAAIAADGSGNAYITGATASGDFPHTAGVVQPSLSVGTCGSAPCPDAFVTKLDPSGIIVYSTFLGGTGSDDGAAIGLDTSGDSYLTGVTASTDFPLQSPFQTYLGGTTNSFVAKLNANATALMFSTYFGTGAAGGALAVDSTGDVFFAGTLSGSEASSVPLVSPLQSTFSGAGMFLSEFDPTGQNLLFSTYFAGDYFDTPAGMAVGNTGDFFLVGTTGSSNFPVYRARQNICPLGANGSNCPDHSEAIPVTGFVAKFNTGTGKALVFVPEYAQNFGTSPVGGNVPGSPILLMNMGTDAVQISGITTTTTDFTASNLCVGPLAGGRQCSIQLSFTPQHTLTRTANLMIMDDDVTSPQQVTLSGFATGNGVVSLSTNTLAFPTQAVGTTQSQQFAITNSGSGPLTFASLLINQGSNDGFSQSNNCPVNPSTLAAGAICTVTVSFTPSRAGAIGPDQLVINSDDVHTPAMVTLSGKGVAAGIGLGLPAGGSSSATVSAGSTANYTLSIGGGGLSGTATLACTGAPTGAACSVPASVPVDAGTASTFKVSVTTTARLSGALVPAQRSSPWFWAMTLTGLLVLPGSRGHRNWNSRCLTWLPILLVLFITSCGGGGGGSGSSGTPAGTYAITVKASVGNTQQSIALKLIVQ